MALLEVRSLTHKFGGLSAVSNFSTSVSADEIVGIIGPNGAGKTTVFNLITGVYRPTAGSICLHGREMAGLAPNLITLLGVARTFQNIRLFKDLTVLDNVRTAHYPRAGYGPLAALFRTAICRNEETRITDQSMELLALFRLDQHADELSKNLPYGLQRRLEIARALATRPVLLLLDEPAAGMSAGEVAQLMDLIRWLRREFKVTVLLIEHQMQLVMNVCERVVVLDFGVTIAEGKPEEVRNNRRVLEAYLGEDGTV